MAETLQERCRRAEEAVCALTGENQRLKADNAELESTFNLQWKADRRAIRRWQQAHPGSDHIWPDRADMVVWLLDQFAALKKKLEKEQKKRMETDLAFALSDSVLPADFEPDLPPTIRLHKFIEKQAGRIAKLVGVLEQVTQICEDGDTGADFKRVVAAMQAARAVLEEEEQAVQTPARPSGEMKNPD
jgi:hypothetical protein